LLLRRQQDVVGFLFVLCGQFVHLLLHRLHVFLRWRLAGLEIQP
jgi:hypothetical protein